MNNKFLALNMANLIHCAVADRQLFHLALQLFKAKTLTPEQSERQLTGYKKLYKRKVQESCKQFVQILSRIETIVDFTVLQFLVELTAEVKRRYTVGGEGKRGNCSVIGVYQVLCTLCELIEDKNVTPFMGYFVESVLEAKEQVETTGKH